MQPCFCCNFFQKYIQRFGLCRVLLAFKQWSTPRLVVGLARSIQPSWRAIFWNNDVVQRYENTRSGVRRERAFTRAGIGLSGITRRRQLLEGVQPGNILCSRLSLAMGFFGGVSAAPCFFRFTRCSPNREFSHLSMIGIHLVFNSLYLYMSFSPYSSGSGFCLQFRRLVCPKDLRRRDSSHEGWPRPRTETRRQARHGKKLRRGHGTRGGGGRAHKKREKGSSAINRQRPEHGPRT